MKHAKCGLAESSNKQDIITTMVKREPRRPKLKCFQRKWPVMPRQVIGVGKVAMLKAAAILRRGMDDCKFFQYRIAGNFQWCIFLYNFKFLLESNFKLPFFKCFWSFKPLPWDTRWANLNFSTPVACFFQHQGEDARLPYLQRHLECRNR